MGTFFDSSYRPGVRGLQFPLGTTAAGGSREYHGPKPWSCQGKGMFRSAQYCPSHSVCDGHGVAQTRETSTELGLLKIYFRKNDHHMLALRVPESEVQVQSTAGQGDL